MNMAIYLSEDHRVFKETKVSFIGKINYIVIFFVTTEKERHTFLIDMNLNIHSALNK